MSGVVLLDNQDSFVYNLVDAMRQFDATVYRNTVPTELIMAAEPDLIVLSPGPGYPVEAGSMMELIAAAQGRVPIFGICLGFQALVEHFGGRVQPCGPVHGQQIGMQLADAGVASGLFDGLTSDDTPDSPGRTVPVARYHSLGTVELPEGMHALARTHTQLGDVVMAARSDDGMSIGLQYHPESILTPAGPIMIERCVAELMKGR
ncbi:glutamine amidotransferase-related protein [Corynebacterium lipophiloflavum]|uniref:anthranilate synthase n=1 Tax=Corynebacterium lipophiloflavum (strain ATCC 700352 / DSM 44291 / CCUG 37336 / JCM 10383 / DMMZ 1944) TaxID=525263 RepID=C0XTF3_CORLD|nr:gamma-glutamyl-gamma-aminobutyrate hydrolase family protein [Corynebacterium lipophiloflavum]EEI16450.1 glutamine amidotransferase, class I [Corynebacterium lipophiloflavum DSM 44291]